MAAYMSKKTDTRRNRYSRPRYERNADGEVEFILKIDMIDFKSEEIKVLQDKLKVSIDVERRTKAYLQMMNAKDYHDIINLPSNSDTTKMMKAFYDNGKLIIKMPIIPQFYSSSTYRREKDNRSAMSLQSDDNTAYIFIVKIDDEFLNGNVSVNVDNFMVYVTITKEEVDKRGVISQREFNSNHQFPSNVLIENLKAELDENILTLSAPYRSTFGSLKSNRTYKSSSSSFFN